MNRISEVKMGGLEVIDGEMGELKTFVGSCVAICLFDDEAKIAAMAHVMLPKKVNVNQHTIKDERGKYADEAFTYMINIMIQKGSDPKRIHAKMAGGAVIFSHESGTSGFNIGPRNIAAIKQILEENCIPLISEDTGANFGRWVKFSLNTCEMTITSN